MKFSEHQKEVINDVIRVSRMESASFKQIGFGGPYPSSEAEADAFIKERIRLWMKTWITEPLEEILTKDTKPSGAYSVLRFGPSGPYLLYCSRKKKGIMEGTEAEMYQWKHIMESAEQHKGDMEYFEDLKKERLGILVSGGASEESATAFLKENMPYLFNIQ